MLNIKKSECNKLSDKIQLNNLKMSHPSAHHPSKSNLNLQQPGGMNMHGAPPSQPASSRSRKKLQPPPGLMKQNYMSDENHSS